MRQFLLLSLLIALAGCATPPARDKRAAGGDSLPPRDFVGLPPEAPPEREAVTGTPARSALGFLAGEVQDSQYRRVANANIQVIEIEDGGRARARLSVSTDRNGYFDVPGLEKGKRYQLVASVQRGDVQYVGRTYAVTNNTRVAIYLTDTRRGGAAPAAGGDERAAPATLGAPTRPAGDGVGKTLDPPPGAMDPLRMARDKERRDFDGGPPPATVNVPPPGRDPGDDPSSRKPVLPPAPPRFDGGSTTPLPGAGPATPTPAPPSGSARLRRSRELPGRTVVPSCVKVGHVVEELALNDYHGQSWALSERQTGKLVLLDFWKVGCPPCRTALPKLVELQARYGPSGLQVVGVLCDGGPVEKRREGVLAAAAEQRTRINYPVLFSEPAECPVRRELEVYVYPSLRLLDEGGRVIWKAEGFTAETAAELEMVIKRRLATP